MWRLIVRANKTATERQRFFAASRVETGAAGPLAIRYHVRIGSFAVVRQGYRMKTPKKSIGQHLLVATLWARRAGRVRLIGSALAQSMLLAGLVASFGAHSAFAGDDAAQPGATATAATGSPSGLLHQSKRVRFEQERASQDARQVADWVVDSDDNRGRPFVIVDKKDARVFVFHADGRLRGAAPALLGLAVGDDSVPGIGDRKLSSIRPEERTTPAGRFVAALDRNLHGGEILWVDYDNAISLHPVITSNPKERRAERLLTPSPLDHRISYGCINVPVDFFRRVVSPSFKGTDGIVYVLPETRSVQKVFASYDVAERERRQAAGQRLPAQVATNIDSHADTR
jgi:hypothetical protein